MAQKLKDDEPIWKDSQITKGYLGIVGASEWPEDKIPVVKEEIGRLLFKLKAQSVFSQVLPSEILDEEKPETWSFRPFMWTIVSGRCPVAVCESCHKLKFAPVDAPLEGYFKCSICGAEKAIRKGGIDIIAEAEALRIKLPTKIFTPEANQFTDFEQSNGQILKGFKSRNLQIAKISNPLIVISPKCPAFESHSPLTASCDYCLPKIHIKTGATLGHRWSGGLLTAWYCESKFGNKVKRIAI